jgi:hypothetical protein
MVASALVVLNVVKNGERNIGIRFHVQVLRIDGFYALHGAELRKAGLRGEVGPAIRATSQIDTFLGDVCEAQGHSSYFVLFFWFQMP